MQITSPGPPARQLRDAIIFLPGLSTLGHRSQAHVMEVLCSELDHAAKTATAHFAVEPGSDKSGEATMVETIWRMDDDDRSPVADVYWLDYGAVQPAEATPARPFARVLTLGLATLAGVLIWLGACVRQRAWFRRNQCGKPGTQMMQLLICLAILLGLVAYFGAAVIALVQLILTRYTSEAGASAPMITWPQVVVIVGAVLGTLTPGLRRQWFTAAEQSLKMMRYLWVAGPRNSLRGEVLALIEHASERDEIGRISIVGFSFGSLVAIDTLFPASKAPTARMERVTSLATIGCPFDLVRMLQPHYYENRFAPDGQDRPWINIYDPVDVLGSNFRDDGKEGSASKGVTIRGTGAVRQPTGNIPWNSGQPLTLISGLMLASVRAHAQYWGPNPRAETALGLLAAELFCGTPALR